MVLSLIKGGLVIIGIVPVNYVAVVVSTVAAMILGYLWYGPLFGKQWMQATGIKKEDAKMAAGPAMLGMVVAALVTAFVLAQVLKWGGAATLMDGLMGAFIVWLGFQLTTLVPEVLFEKKNKTVFYLAASHHLVAMLIMGAILVSM